MGPNDGRLERQTLNIRTLYFCRYMLTMYELSPLGNDFEYKTEYRTRWTSLGCCTLLVWPNR